MKISNFTLNRFSLLMAPAQPGQPTDIISHVISLLIIIAILVCIVYAIRKAMSKPAELPVGPLSDSERMMHYDALKRNAGVVYVLWFFLGGVGVHRIVAGKVGSGIGMFALTFLSLMLTVVGIGFFGLFAVGIWWFIDVFLIGGWIRQYNENLIKKLGGTRIQ